MNEKLEQENTDTTASEQVVQEDVNTPTETSKLSKVDIETAKGSSHVVSAKARGIRTIKRIYVYMGVLATIGGAIAFFQMFAPKSAPEPVVSETVQMELLKQIEKGKLTPEQALAFARELRGQAFPNSQYAFADTPQENSPEAQFEDRVKTIAQSDDDVKRYALVLATDPTTRKDGLDMLASVANSAEDWRELGALAQAWDTARARSAFEKAIENGSQNTWDYIYLSRLYLRAGDLATAKMTAQKALGFTTDDRNRSALFIELGDVAKAQGDLKEARAFYTGFLAITKILANQNASNTQLQRDLSISYNKIGDIARVQGDLDGAREFYTAGLDIRKTFADQIKGNAQFHRDLWVSYNKVGMITKVQGDLKGARAFYTDGLAIATTLANQDASNTQFQRDLSISYEKLGDVTMAQGELDGARGFYADGLVIRKTLADQDTSNIGFQRDLSVSYDRLGDIAWAQGDLEGALGFYADGLVIRKILANQDASNAGFQRNLMVSHYKLAELGGAEEHTHWNEAYRVLKALDDAGKMLPTDKSWLEHLKQKVEGE